VHAIFLAWFQQAREPLSSHDNSSRQTGVEHDSSLILAVISAMACLNRMRHSRRGLREVGVAQPSFQRRRARLRLLVWPVHASIRQFGGQMVAWSKQAGSIGSRRPNCRPTLGDWSSGGLADRGGGTGCRLSWRQCDHVDVGVWQADQIAEVELGPAQFGPSIAGWGRVSK